MIVVSTGTGVSDLQTSRQAWSCRVHGQNKRGCAYSTEATEPSTIFLSGQHRHESHISEEKMHATPDAAASASQCQPVPAAAANASAPHPASPGFAAWTCVARRCIKRRDAVVLAATPSGSMLHALPSE